MSEEFKAIVDSSFDNGTPLWLYTKDYIYGVIPLDPEGNRWKEVSYTFDDPEEPLIIKERNADLTFQFVLEEVEKGTAFYVEDLKVVKIKDFAKSLDNKPGPEKLRTLINELINNSQEYSENLPIIKSKEELGILKEKL